MFFKSDSLHPYCKNACEPVTMCGEVRVPEEHLEVMMSLCEYFFPGSLGIFRRELNKKVKISGLPRLQCLWPELWGGGQLKSRCLKFKSRSVKFLNLPNFPFDSLNPYSNIDYPRTWNQ